MKPKNNKAARHRIYGILNRLDNLKHTTPRDHADTCPIYSPPQKCVKGECVWYSVREQQCWVLNPKPLKDKANRE